MIFSLQIGDPEKLVVHFKGTTKGRMVSFKESSRVSFKENRRPEKISVPDQAVRGRNSTFSRLSILCRFSKDCMMFVCTLEGHLIYSVHKFKCPGRL